MGQDNRESIRFAVWGQSGAGKTTLLASYYGLLGSAAFSERQGYELAVRDSGALQTLRALSGRLKEGAYPAATARANTFEFTVRVRSKSAWVDALQVVWSDFPGKWLEVAPSDDEERQERDRLLREIAAAHASVVLFDGERYAKEGAVFLAETLRDFREELQPIVDAQSPETKEALRDRSWIFALSKSDARGHSFTAHEFADEFSENESVHAELLRFFDAVGHDRTDPVNFLMLTAARRRSDGCADPMMSRGLHLIAPLTLVGALQRAERLARQDQQSWIWWLAGGALRVLTFGIAATAAAKSDIAKKSKWKIVAAIAGVLGSLGVEEFLKKKADDLKTMRDEALERGDALGAAMSALSAELRSEFARNDWLQRVIVDRGNGEAQ